jgi:hypothetical protein
MESKVETEKRFTEKASTIKASGKTASNMEKARRYSLIPGTTKETGSKDAAMASAEK